MKSDEPLEERLLRLLEGHVSPAERALLEQELRTSPSAREALRVLAEEAVLLTDVGRTMAARRDGTETVRFPKAQARPALWAWAALVALALLALGVAALGARNGGPELARVVKVTGASGVFGARGSSERPLPAGVRLRAGDMIETRSCDSWVELELPDGSHLTVAGHSALRLLKPAAGSNRVSLLRGSLWLRPSTHPGPAPLSIQTPTSLVEAGQAQFDLQTTASESILRVNQGQARLLHRLQDTPVQVPAGFQTHVALATQTAPVPLPQPEPVSSWTCTFDDEIAILLGRRLATGAGEPHRMGAVPLLWPVPERPPIMLHAVSVSVLQTVGRPVELHPDTRVRFHGRTLKKNPVRFGFSTQRMRGVFAGKFETDVPAGTLLPVGEPWTVDLPLTAFRPLHPELSDTAAGLELSDIYALTVIADAGLELHRIEVTAP